MKGKKILLFFIVLLALPSFVFSVLWDLVNDKYPVFDSTPSCITVTADRVYYGGSFTMMAYKRMFMGEFNIATGAPTEIFPVLELMNNGSSPYINGAVSDGSGGWYVCGYFKSMGGVEVNNLAHILSNGTVDPDWLPNPGECYDIDSVGNTVIVTGYLGTLFGSNRSYMAAFDKNTGELLPFNPSFDSIPYYIDVEGNTLYMTGYFTTVASQPRQYIAAMDIRNGTLLPWAPTLNSYASKIEAVGNTVFVVGSNISTVNGTPRQYFAAINKSGALMPYTLAMDNYINSVDSYGNTLFVAGYFTSIGGQPRRYMAAINVNTGAVMSFDPQPNSDINVIEVSGNTLLAGGYYTYFIPGSVNRSRVAAFDTRNGSLLPFYPVVFDSGVSVLKSDGSKLFASGNFFSAKAYKTNYLASVDAATGAPAGFNSGTDNYVNALAVHGNRLYLGGYFNSISDTASTYFGAVDRFSGAYIPITPVVNSYINVLDVAGNTLYAGGSFTSFNGSGRYYAAAYDLSTETLLPWNPSLNSTVDTLKQYKNMVLLGGAFSAANDTYEARDYICAVDQVTGTVLDWNPGFNNSVTSIETFGNTVFAAGYFDYVGPNARKGLASFYSVASDFVSNTMTSWDPGADNSLRSLFVYHGMLFVSGQFNIIGGVTRDGFAAVKLTDYTVTGRRYIKTTGRVAMAGLGDYLLTDSYFDSNYYEGYGKCIYIGPDISPYSGPASVPTPVPARSAHLVKNLANISAGEKIKIRISTLENGKNAVVTIYSRKGAEINKIEMTLDGSDIEWDGKNSRGEKAGSGIYIIRVEAGEVKETLKAIIVR